MNQFSRTQLIIGKKAMETLNRARVAVFGIGGVGGYVAEGLVRAGVGRFLLVDNDQVSLTNLNRQIIATHSTIGRDKTEVMKERILDIYPQAQVDVRKCFYLPENADEFDFTGYSYVVDAVDTVTAKLELIIRAQRAGVPVISCMGTGNKIDPGQLHISDIFRTDVCPLAKVMRRECRKRNIQKLKVLFSTEQAIRPEAEEGEQEISSKRSIPGSISFVPSVAGLMIAGEVVRDLIQTEEKNDRKDTI